MSTHPVPAAAAVVELSGGISDDLADCGRENAAAVLAHAGLPVPRRRLRVVRHHDPARAEPVVATVVVDLDGRPVHVRVTAGRPRDRPLHRTGPAGVGLVQADGRADLVPPGTVEANAGTDPAPRLSAPRAVERMQITATPFVFHVGDGGRAAVVHRTREGGVGQVAFPDDRHD